MLHPNIVLGPDKNQLMYARQNRADASTGVMVLFKSEGEKALFLFAQVDDFEDFPGRPDALRLTLSIPSTGGRWVGIYSTVTCEGTPEDTQAVASATIFADLLDLDLATLGFGIDIVDACTSGGITTLRQLARRPDLDNLNLMIWYNNPTGANADAAFMEAGLDRFVRLNQRLDQLRRRFAAAA